jgi:hypothetical protein
MGMGGSERIASRRISFFYLFFFRISYGLIETSKRLCSSHGLLIRIIVVEEERPLKQIQSLSGLQRSFFFDHDDTDQQPMTAAQPFAGFNQPCMNYGRGFMVRGWLLGQFLLPNDLDLCVLLAVLVFVGWVFLLRPR